MLAPVCQASKTLFPQAPSSLLATHLWPLPPAHLPLTLDTRCCQEEISASCAAALSAVSHSSNWKKEEKRRGNAHAKGMIGRLETDSAVPS